MEVLTLENGKRILTSNAYIVTDQDLQIIKALAEGETPKSIAKILCLSPRTVEAHKDKLRTVFNAKTTPHLVCIAKDLNLI